MRFSLVVAADQNMGIGKNNALPWPHLKGDMSYFAEVTTRAAEGKMNAVIMGRKTWESIPESRRPLKGRLNLVLSRGGVEVPEGVMVENSFDAALKRLDSMEDVEKIFVIGGANVFEQALRHPDCDTVYLTEVLATFDCDVLFPPLDEKFELVSRSEEHDDNGIVYRFAVYRRKNLDK